MAITREKAIDNIIEFFDREKDLFNEAVEQLDWYNGYLGDNKYYDMCMLDELYHDADPLELLRRAYYGYDEDWYTTDSSGNRHYGEFNPNRDWFKFNGYGNLVSTDWIDYSDYNDRYAIESMLENRAYIDIIDEDSNLCELFDILEEIEED